MNKIEIENEYKRIFNNLLHIALEDTSLIGLFGCSLQGAAVDLMGAISKRDREKLENNQRKLTSFSKDFELAFKEFNNLTQLLTEALNNEISLKEGSEVPHA
jgi:hypothetical protein